MKSSYPKITLHRTARGAANTSKFAGAYATSVASGFQLAGIEEVEPRMAKVPENGKLGYSILIYERRGGRGRQRLSVTRGYTSPAKVAGAPEGSYGHVEIHGRTATWIQGAWEVENPTATPPWENPEARWAKGVSRLTWEEEGLISTTLESRELSVNELIDVARGSVPRATQE